MFVFLSRLNLFNKEGNINIKNGAENLFYRNYPCDFYNNFHGSHWMGKV